MGMLTAGEMKTIVSGLFSVESTIVSNVIVAATGLCHDCGDRGNTHLIDTFGPEATGNAHFAAVLMLAPATAGTCRNCLAVDNDSPCPEMADVDNAVSFLTEEPIENIDSIYIIIEKKCNICGQFTVIKVLDNLDRDNYGPEVMTMIGHMLEARNVEFRATWEGKENE